MRTSTSCRTHLRVRDARLADSKQRNFVQKCAPSRNIRVAVQTNDALPVSQTGNGHATTSAKQTPEDTRIAQLEAEVEKLKALVFEQQALLREMQPSGNQRTLRRMSSMFDPRFHSTSRGVSYEDWRVLPARIVLIRHAESAGNVDCNTYQCLPDNQVPLTQRGQEQALGAGEKLRQIVDADGSCGSRIFFYISPYKRSRMTYDNIRRSFQDFEVKGVREDVQLREQDFGNFQDPARVAKDLQERNMFGRFWYRFPNGESGADVYDRITLFVDHLVRDMNAGLFSERTSVVMVTHGLALRIFLMRWFHWTVDQFLLVYNPPNAQPIVMEKIPWEEIQAAGYANKHTKKMYRLANEYVRFIDGCTEDMCNYLPGLQPAPGAFAMSTADEEVTGS